MNDESVYKRIQEVFGELPENFNILEEQIDINLQMEYFDYSRKIKRELKPEEIISAKEKIFSENITDEERKIMLVILASVDDIEAYRIIEKFLVNATGPMRDWAILALQESRMMLQSKLLDENQVFISTGLGGKGSKLRYFIVFIVKEGKELTEEYQQFVTKELNFNLKKHDIEIEDIVFYPRFCTITAIIPIAVSLKDTFKNAIHECNMVGDFLRTNFIVTNVKRLTVDEIESFLSKHNLDEDDSGEDDDIESLFEDLNPDDFED